MSRETQCAAILRVLRAGLGGWVPLRQIIMAQGSGRIIGQYNARLKELRDGEFDGVKHNIVNKAERIDDVVHSWYRLYLPSGQVRMKGV